MNEPIAVVDGKAIYSDKRLTKVKDTKVSFSDGSWCDVKTGAVVNTGVGYININAPDETESEKITLGPRLYTAANIDIGNMKADVEVKVANSNKISVTIEGPKSEVDSLTVHEQSGIVVVKGAVSRSDMCGSSYVFSGMKETPFGSNVMIFGRGTIDVTTQTQANETKVTIEVPKGTSVTVSDIDGPVHIDSTFGPLKAKASVGNEIVVGRVLDAELESDSGSEITVAEVTGSLVAEASSGSEITVKDGEIDTLKIDVSSGASVRFLGQTRKARLEASSGANISVRHVEKKPKIDRSSGAEVRVSNW